MSLLTIGLSILITIILIVFVESAPKLFTLAGEHKNITRMIIYPIYFIMVMLSVHMVIN